MPFIGLALPEKLVLNVERPYHSTACGFICTGIALVAGVSGPVLDIFFIRSKMSRHSVVSTKALSQTLTHLSKIAFFGGVAVSTGADVPPLVAALMIALAFGGTTLSRTVLERIDDSRFRQWTRWTVTGVGSVYLISGTLMILK
jgi:hypothetical protein